MQDSVFADMQRYIGFDAHDAENLRALAPVVQPFLPTAIERFYADILRHPGTRNVLTGGRKQMVRLRKSLGDWVNDLFSGVYDEAYLAHRELIGRTHVRVGLPQHYMFTAMESLWQELEKAIRQADPPDADDKLRSLHKLLTLETGLMLESYKASYTEHARQDERSLVQERLTRAEHLAEIGHLAASLAHEIKNPLAGISGAIQVIRDSMQEQDPHRPVVAEILRQIHRLDRTVKDLLVYARPNPPRFQRCDLSQVIRRVMTVLSREPEVQRVRLEYADSRHLPLYADESQIEQLVLNLVLNAAQASADGSPVQIRTTSNAQGFLLVIEDRGQGMDEATFRRAFEPFHTTKSKGTGLGLPICQKIVESHGGTIAIHSVLNEGTIVSVQLPRYPPTVSKGSEHDDSRADR